MLMNIDTLSTPTPIFLASVPFYLTADVANNIWMEELSVEERAVDSQVALSQFFELYSYLTRSSIVYLLPSRPGLQDQTFVSNLGIVLPHLQVGTVVVSRFFSEPRIGESEVGIEFFRTMNFSVHSVPERIDSSFSTGLDSRRRSSHDGFLLP